MPTGIILLLSVCSVKSFHRFPLKTATQSQAPVSSRLVSALHLRSKQSSMQQKLRISTPDHTIQTLQLPFIVIEASM